MRITMPALLLAALVTASSGCSICAPGYLDDYAAVGGKWERTNPTQGRVGSILSDHGVTANNTIIEGTDDGVYYEYDDVYGDMNMNDGDVIYDEGYVEDVPYESPSDEGVIILGEQW